MSSSSEGNPEAGTAEVEAGAVEAGAVDVEAEAVVAADVAAVVEADAAAEAVEERPALRIVKGNPTAEEIAALVTVFSAASGGVEEEPEQVSAWASPAELHRASLPVGAPNAWVLSGR